MPDTDNAAAGVSECAAETTRMRKEYVPPTEVDIAGADALMVAVPPGIGPTAPEWAPLTQILSALASQNKVRGKLAAIAPGGDAATNAAFAAALGEVGFTLVGPAAAAGAATPGSLAHVQAHGRLVAETSRALKSSR